MRRVFTLLFLVVFSFALFANGKKEAKSDGVITLNLWDIMVSESDERVIKPAIEKWNAEHPEIQVVRDSLDDASYKKKIKTAIAANEAPDLFYTCVESCRRFCGLGKIQQLRIWITLWNVGWCCILQPGIIR